MLPRVIGKIFKVLILAGISGFFWMSAEHRATLVSKLPEPIRAKLETPKRFMAERLPSAERALDAAQRWWMSSDPYAGRTGGASNAVSEISFEEFR